MYAEQSVSNDSFDQQKKFWLDFNKPWVKMLGEVKFFAMWLVGTCANKKI